MHAVIVVKLNVYTYILGFKLVSTPTDQYTYNFLFFFKLHIPIHASFSITLQCKIIPKSTLHSFFPFTT